ncbi:MAG: HAD family hydrolase [Thermodesulfobacteriota bacterium]
MKLVLFDIDGTLINPAGAGTRSANAAFLDIFEIEEAFAGIRMAGKTDIRIMKEGLAANRILLEDGIMGRILSRYLLHLEREIKTPEKRLMPGVEEVLEVLERREDVHLGLLTGNIEQGARIKLAPFSLNERFPCGAFGDDHEDRDRLLPIAARKFRALKGLDVPPADCIVVGDTPADVRCAKLHGATAVAVATGPYDLETLMRTEADYAFEDLPAAASVLRGL